jgi:hypothetical protein
LENDILKLRILGWLKADQKIEIYIYAQNKNAPLQSLNKFIIIKYTLFLNQLKKRNIVVCNPVGL